MNMVHNRARFLADIMGRGRREPEVQRAWREDRLVKRRCRSEHIKIVDIVDIRLDIRLSVNITKDLAEALRGRSV